MLINWLTRQYLKTFQVTQRQLSEGEYSAAMIQIESSPQLKVYLNILLGNLIRRHLYIKDMGESNWYLGQITAIRKIQTDVERWKSQNKPVVDNKLDNQTSL
jgi:hypothetical protein